MPWNSWNTVKPPAKKAGGGITLSFDVPANVVTNIVTGWTVYTIKGNVVATATVTGTTSINILAVGGGGGSYGTPTISGGGGGGGRFLEITKTINMATPTQTITCLVAANTISYYGSRGGNTEVKFSDSAVGNIFSGGGGCGGSAGSTTTTPPVGGGSGGGGGSSSGGGDPGGIAQNGFDGGSGSVNLGGGGGGGAAGVGQNRTSGGGGGPGKAPTLNGIKLVYTGNTFCGGGGGAPSGTAGCVGAGVGGAISTNQSSAQNATGFGCGAGGYNPLNNVTPYTYGGPGVVIIAVPT
jgi:hypothetical protein